jgi:hypothetical protein
MLDKIFGKKESGCGCCGTRIVGLRQINVSGRSTGIMGLEEMNILGYGSFPAIMDQQMSSSRKRG